MLLAIDVGNTNVVIGCITEDGEITNVFRMESDIMKTDDEYAVNIKLILELHNIDKDLFTGAIISSVVPPLISVFKSAVKHVIGVDALVVGSGIKTGLNILLDNPAQMGSDLVAGAVAAVNLYKLPAIVYDMGTATTISAIAENADFLGGVIVPGLALSLNALSSRTSQLPKVPIEAPKSCIGKNTIDSMKSGAIFATCAMVDGMIDRIEDEIGQSATVIATGGLAKCIVPYCRHDIICDDNLLLKGLYILYNKNKKVRKK